MAKEIDWGKREEESGIKLEEGKKFVQNWEDNKETLGVMKILDRKRERMGQNPMVITEFEGISPVGEDRAEHEQNFHDGKSAKIIKKYLRDGETFEEKDQKEGDVAVSTMEINPSEALLNEIEEVSNRKDPKGKRTINNIFNNLDLGHYHNAVVDRVLRNSELTQDEISFQTPLTFGSGCVVSPNIEFYSIKNTQRTLRRGNLAAIQGMPSALSSAAVVVNKIYSGHNSLSNACASYLSAISMGIKQIIAGDDKVLVSCADSIRNNVALASFAALQALGEFNAPFDRSAQGFIPSEGAYAMLLEAKEEALERRTGKKPLIEIVGFAESSDADKNTANPNTIRQIDTIMTALHNAGLKAEDIDEIEIDTHGTSTPIGDPSELIAIKSVFGYKGIIKASKSYGGHQIGGSPGLSAMSVMSTLRFGTAPKILNLHDIIPEGEGLIFANNQKTNTTYKMINSFGFGGINTCLILKKITT